MRSSEVRVATGDTPVLLSLVLAMIVFVSAAVGMGGHKRGQARVSAVDRVPPRLPVMVVMLVAVVAVLAVRRHKRSQGIVRRAHGRVATGLFAMLVMVFVRLRLQLARCSRRGDATACIVRILLSAFVIVVAMALVCMAVRMMPRMMPVVAVPMVAVPMVMFATVSVPR